MMNKFEKMLEKKGKKLSPMQQKAKGDVLSDLRDQASDEMAKRLPNRKEKMPHEESDYVTDMPKDDQYLPEAQEDGLSLEELEKKIDMLMQLKDKLSNKE